MHEANFTGQIVQAIVTELKKYPDYKPKRVKVRVGGMLHLDRDSVSMHYNVMTHGTPLEAVELDLEEEEVVIYCWQCNHKGPVADHHLLMCSICNTTDVEVMSGNEIVIDAIELEKPWEAKS